MGAGLGKKLASVRWNVVGQMAGAWVLTIIAGAGAFGLWPLAQRSKITRLLTWTARTSPQRPSPACSGPRRRSPRPRASEMAIVIIAFAILLIAIKRARSAENSETVRLGSWALAGVCGAFVAAAIAIGVIAMVNKPSRAKPAPKKSAAAVTLRQQQHRLVA